jgi:hypothetical protein
MSEPASTQTRNEYVGWMRMMAFPLNLRAWSARTTYAEDRASASMGTAKSSARNAGGDAPMSERRKPLVYGSPGTREDVA